MLYPYLKSFILMQVT